MKNWIFALYLTLGTLMQVYSQGLTSDKEWELLLNDVRIRYTYSLKYDALIPKPKFGEQLKKLNGQTIVLKGFFIPISLSGDLFVLSYNPMNMCFFCTGSGIETVVEVSPATNQAHRFSRLKIDDFIELKGVLHLNDSDPEGLVYQLKSAEFMRFVKF